MDTPEFNQRFGILLEAYLRGCGEAMFVSAESFMCIHVYSAQLPWKSVLLV